MAAELFVEAESTFQNSSYIVNSLTVDQREILLSGLPTPVLTNWVQLFSQADGWYSVNFHSKCDKKGPTVILVRTAPNFIFGGYAEVS